MLKEWATELQEEVEEVWHLVPAPSAQPPQGLILNVNHNAHLRPDHLPLITHLRGPLTEGIRGLMIAVITGHPVQGKGIMQIPGKEHPTGRVLQIAAGQITGIETGKMHPGMERGLLTLKAEMVTEGILIIATET